MTNKEGREEELLELQRAEEFHREGLLKEREERERIAKELHSLQREHLVSLEARTERELAALQREREVLLIKEREKLLQYPPLQVRQKIMEQDNIYQQALDEATRNLENRKVGMAGGASVDKAYWEREAITIKQVELAERHGAKAGALRAEREALQQELKGLQDRIRKTADGQQKHGLTGGLAPSQANEDALSELLNDAGLQAQTNRLQRLKASFEQERAKAVDEGYIKEYEEAAKETRSKLSTQEDKVGCQGEYADATAGEYLDKWLSGDAKKPEPQGSDAGKGKPATSANNHARTRGGGSSPAPVGGKEDGKDTASHPKPKTSKGNGSNDSGLERDAGNNPKEGQGEGEEGEGGHRGSHIQHSMGQGLDSNRKHGHGKAHHHGPNNHDHHSKGRGHHPHQPHHHGHHHHHHHHHSSRHDRGHGAVANKPKAEHWDTGQGAGDEGQKESKLQEAVEKLQAELEAMKLVQTGTGGEPVGSGAGSGPMGLGSVFPSGKGAAGTCEAMGGGWGIEQYIATLDAENARMNAELQGMAGPGGTWGPGATPLPPFSLVSGGALGSYPGAGGEQGEPAGAAGVGGHAGSGNVVVREPSSDADKKSRPPESPRMREQQRKMAVMAAQHNEEVKKLEFEMERLELEQRLEDMRERMAREKKNRQLDVAHEQWVTEQARNLQAIKIQKACTILAKENQLMEVQKLALQGGEGIKGKRGIGGVMSRPGVGGIVQRPYSEDDGFCVFWDYILGLPRRRGSRVIFKVVRLVYGLYVGGRLQGNMGSTPYTEVSDEEVINENTGRGVTCCLLDARHMFNRVVPNCQTRVVVEMQFKDKNGKDGKPAKDSTLGWGTLHVFAAEKANPAKLTVRVGLVRLSIFPGNVDLRCSNPNDIASYMSKSISANIFLRCVCGGQDANTAGGFVVNPDTQHLYNGYGRGLMPQNKRQELMIGTFIRAVMVAAKLKRASALHKRKRAARISKLAKTSASEKEEEDSDLPPTRDSSRLVQGILALGPFFPHPCYKRVLYSDDLNDNDEEEGSSMRRDDGVDDYSRRDSMGKDEAEGYEEDSGNEEDKMDQRRTSTMSLDAAIATQMASNRRNSINRRRQSVPSRELIGVNDGFDIYVDRGVGMPRSCTVSKLMLRAFGNHGKAQAEVWAVSNAFSPPSTPTFNLREEFRPEKNRMLDMTMTLLMRVETIERHSKEHAIVGYSVLNTFIDENGKQPRDSNAKGMFLNKGDFQVPVYQRPPPNMNNLDGTSMEGLPRVPCAFLQVRIKPCPKSPDGANLGKDNVPREQWQKLGVYVPPLENIPGVYSTRGVEMTDLEKAIMELRAKDHKEELICDIGTLIAPTRNPAPAVNPDTSPEVFMKWAAELMIRKCKKMIDLIRVEKYCPEKGFSVLVAGLVNMKSKAKFQSPSLYKANIEVLFSLLSPGLFYQDPPMTDQAEFTLTYDINSSFVNPRFMDSPHVYSHQKFNPNQCLILDVRCIKVNQGKGLAKIELSSSKNSTGSWGIIPIFLPNDVAAGSFVVPLFAGPFPKELLHQSNPLRHMTEQTKAKDPNYRPIEGSSVVVQINNALLQGVIPQPFKDPGLSFTYVQRLAEVAGMKEGKWHFQLEDRSEATSKSLVKIVPKSFKNNPQTFFDRINHSFAAATGI
ncbi:unnamed protein product, partial [Discosporangium mesarthrocarpum]